MSQARTPLLFPVGRFVGGDLYEPNTKDADGNPLIVKNGPNAGQKRVEYFVQIAVAKEPGKQWWETAWGQVIYQAGAQAFPQAVAMPTFAWKIKDGDDATPRFRNGKPTKAYNQREGWAGCWVIGISSGYAPKIVNADGTAEITDAGAVKPGYYVQVFGNVSGNGSQQKPGVHINHNGIALSGYGPEITSGVDLANVGFGGALPAGASAVPLAGMSSVPPQAQPAPAGPASMPTPGAPVGMPAPAGFPGAPGAAAAAYTPPAAMPAGVPQIAGVSPNPAFLSVSGTPAAPSAPAAPPAAPAAPAAPVRQMTAAAQFTYEQYRQAGWTDAQLVGANLMLP